MPESLLSNSLHYQFKTHNHVEKNIIYCSLICFWLPSVIAQGQIKHQVTFSTNVKIVEKPMEDREIYTFARRRLQPTPS
jgi:hypothetical protein